MVRWCVVAVLLGGYTCACATVNNGDNNDIDSTQSKGDNDEYLLKQVVWKRCYRKLSPACLKLSLVRTVEMMSKDSSFALLPGVFFSSNYTETNPLPPEIARSLSSEHAPLDDLVAFALGKYLRSLTLNVNLVDFISGGNETLQNSVIDVFSGRGKKDGLGGYGAIAAMMGGMMASMMMAALAALAGKALMTSLLALMMAAFAAMKGGGGGDHESKHYEVITKPVVSHINTHSSEVQHEHGHYHKRSVDSADPGLRIDPSGPYRPFIGETHVNQESTIVESSGVEGNDRSFNVPDSHIIQKKPSPEDSLEFNEPVYKWGRDNEGKRIQLAGHPQQDHRKYKRYVEDDLMMALGLFR